MAVVSCGAAPNTGGMTIDKDKATIKRYFKVICNSFSDDEVTVLSANCLPAYYSQYPTYPMAVANKFECQRLQDNVPAWLVTVTFETPQNQDQHNDPKEDLPTISISSENFQVAASDVSDPDDDPITNSFGDPYDPQPAVDRARSIIRIKRNEDISTDVADLVNTYVDTINSASWFGFDEHTVKCQSISAEGPKIRNQPNGNSIYYIEVSYQFCYQPKGWDLVLLDQGQNYRDENGNTVAFKGKDGVPKIGLLDGTGGQSDEPTFLDPIQIYSSADFNELNLPQNYSQCTPFPTGISFSGGGL